MSTESLDTLIARHDASPHALVQILREAQAAQGWLPRETLGRIAQALGLTLAHVQGVAGFYRFLHTRPVGAYRVLFSNNITDRMLGVEALMRDLCQRLGVTRGQVRADGRVSIDLASCTGLCDQGPAMLVNHHHIVTRLNPGRIEHIAALIEAQVPPSSWPAEWSRVDDQIRLADVKLGPQAAPGESVFDHNVFCIAGDGCMQEGVSGEASSMAATLELGNLFLIYDDNRISIEGDTKIAFSEDVQARYDAYGWDTYHVDFTNGFTTYEEKVAELYDVLERAKQVTDKPHFIKVTTIIGWPLPNKQGDHSVHGSKLGGAEISALKAKLGFEDKPFAVDTAVVDATRANAAARAVARRP